MKYTLEEVELVVQNTVFDNCVEPFTFDCNEFLDMSPSAHGRLLSTNHDFYVFELVPLQSFRVGPTKIAPTRYRYELHFSLYTKQDQAIPGRRAVAEVASWFEERTIDGVRFRTYTPYPSSKDAGFTVHSGVIPFDFELYRGGH